MTGRSTERGPMYDVKLFETEKDRLEALEEFIKNPIYLKFRLHHPEINNLYEIIESLLIFKTGIDKS